MFNSRFESRCVKMMMKDFHLEIRIYTGEIELEIRCTVSHIQWPVVGGDFISTTKPSLSSDLHLSPTEFNVRLPTNWCLNKLIIVLCFAYFVSIVLRHQLFIVFQDLEMTLWMNLCCAVEL